MAWPAHGVPPEQTLQPANARHRTRYEGNSHPLSRPFNQCKIRGSGLGDRQLSKRNFMRRMIIALLASIGLGLDCAHAQKRQALESNFENSPEGWYVYDYNG